MINRYISSQKTFTLFGLTLFYLFSPLIVANVAAQGVNINVSTIIAASTVGNIRTLEQVFIFAFNLLRYLGWAGVIIGVGLAIFSLIYKLMNTDSDEVMKTVQGNLTKAVIIVLAGILLISAGFIMSVVGNLFGITTLGFNFGFGLRTP